MFEAGCQMRPLWNNWLENLCVISQYALGFLSSWDMGSVPGVREPKRGKKLHYSPFGLRLRGPTALSLSAYSFHWNS